MTSAMLDEIVLLRCLQAEMEGFEGLTLARNDLQVTLMGRVTVGALLGAFRSLSIEEMRK